MNNAIETETTERQTADENLQSQINNLETYSTSEKEIGKWIDGKTLYRKIITYTTVGGYNYISIGNINIIKINFFTKQIKNNYTYVYHDTFYYSETDRIRLYVRNNDLLYHAGTEYGFGATTFILEYTK